MSYPGGVWGTVPATLFLTLGPPRRSAPSFRASRTTTLLTYGDPVSNDIVSIAFKQPIAANGGPRAGSYGKTLTFTPSTTNP